MQIYLDYNATTPLDPEVVATMQPLLTGSFGNPSSVHSYGFEARRIVETAREQVAKLLFCKTDEVVFTSGGSESNNMAIQGIARANSHRGMHIITSSIEHPATLEACRYLEKEGFRVDYLPVDHTGLVDFEALKNALREDTILISIMHANNEIGTIQPVREIAELARQQGIPFHMDAAQSAGKIRVSARDTGADLISVAGHKLYGPKGIGALYIRDGIELAKLIHGADHEKNRRAGTENVLLIAGLGKACEVASRNLDQNSRVMKQTRDALYERIAGSIEGLLRNGHPELCLPNTLSLSFPGIEANLIMAGMPGLAVSAGAACHSDHTDISEVLKAIGLDEYSAMGTIRFSTGKNTSQEEIEQAASEVIRTVSSLMPESGMRREPSAEGTEVKLTRFTQGLGCACKMRPQDLEEVLNKMPLPEHSELLVDARDSDDATVWRTGPDSALVQSVDFFTPVVDDPFIFGQITAANALSDLYAMGATPLFALNIVAFPTHRLPLSVLHRILEGARLKADEAGMLIVGGHSIDDNELKYGMVVNGTVHPDKILRNSGSKHGDALILTKPLGTGILSTAMKRGLLEPSWEIPLINSMTGLNDRPARLFERFSIHAVTDVTGFGLLGHLMEMCRAGRVYARIRQDMVPLLEGVHECAKAGMVPGGSMQNLDFVAKDTGWKPDTEKEMKYILADAQTSGGLLISLPADEAGTFLDELHKTGSGFSRQIGTIHKTGNSLIQVD